MGLLNWAKLLLAAGVEDAAAPNSFSQQEIDKAEARQTGAPAMKA